MKRHLIIGCGYTGLALCKEALQKGQAVTGTSRGLLRRADVEDTGAHFVTFDVDEQPLKLPLSSVDAVTLLAPPPEDLLEGARRIRHLAEAAKGASIVIVVSTALYGESRGTVSERTRPAAATHRGKRWEIADATALMMRREGHRISVVRTPAIYGPGRDFQQKLEEGTAVAIEGAPVVSRIHRDDLAQLIMRMHEDDAPPVLLACDEMPTPTSRALDEAARLLSLPKAPRISVEQAKERFSEVGFEMRMGGHVCKSVVQPLLGVRLHYRTYREGLRACLRPSPQSN